MKVKRKSVSGCLGKSSRANCAVFSYALEIQSKKCPIFNVRELRE